MGSTSEDQLAMKHVLGQCGGDCSFCRLIAGLEALESIRQTLGEIGATSSSPGHQEEAAAQ